jgi:(R,R)-butanediol dehydrogenase / meso-butanediol dehydrogenase / diacetyl reductase
MRAGVFRGVRQVPIEDVPEPSAGAADIVLDVRACGICGSDLHTYVAAQLAQEGQVMGHEFAGEVVEVGADVEGIAVGDRVTGLPIQPCGACTRCREGSRHLCEVWTTRSIGYGLPGGFAERLRIPDAVLDGNVHRLPDALTFEDGALVEPLAVGVHAVGRADLDGVEVAVVLGLGTIGLQVAQVLLARGVPRVIGADLSPLRRSVAAQLGVTAVAGGDIGAAVAEAADGREVDVVFEATGAPALVQGAMELVRAGGTVIVIALYERRGEIDPTLMVQKELTVRGSAIYTSAEFHEAIELLATGRAQAQPLITHRHGLEELGEAFEAQLDKDAAIKVMVSPAAARAPERDAVASGQRVAT